MLIPLAASSAQAQAQGQSYHSSYENGWGSAYRGHHDHDRGHHDHDRAHSYHWGRWNQPRAQRRTIWQTARSIMPRFADVAYETASSLSIPALALLTLFVFWPEHKHYRSKRNIAGDEEASTNQLAAHLGNILTAAMEGDECMQKVVCEIGVATSTSLLPHHRKMMSRLVTSFAPARYTTLLSTFKTGADTEKCDNHTCNAFDLHQ